MRSNSFNYILIVLISILAVFFAYKAVDTYIDMHSYQKNSSMLDALDDTAELEGLLSKENFYSVLYLGVNGVNYLVELEESRKKVDSYLDTLKQKISDYGLEDKYVGTLEELRKKLKATRLKVDGLEEGLAHSPESISNIHLMNKLYLEALHGLSSISKKSQTVFGKMIVLINKRRALFDERSISALFLARNKGLDNRDIKNWEKTLEGKVNLPFADKEIAKAKMLADIPDIEVALDSIREDIFEHIDDGAYATKLYEIEGIFSAPLHKIDKSLKTVSADALKQNNLNIAQKQMRFFQYLAATLIVSLVLLVLFRSISSNKKERIALEESLKEIVSDLDEDSRKELKLIIDKRDRSAIYRFLSKTALEARAAEERALQAEKTKDLFLANMSHEIRTPLNGILGFTQLMRSTPLNSEQEEFMDVIAGSSENLLKIVNDILDLSKIRAGKIELETIQFNIIEHLEKAIEPHATKALEKGIECSAFIDPSLPLVLGDPTKLSQVMTNLIGNAVKFTNDGGSVNVEVRKIRDTDDTVTVHFSVKDSGIGIEPDQIKKIFEPFMQADISTTREFGGTGLGLTITKDIIAHMGGKLDVISEKGKGSEFFFELIFDKAGADENLQNRLEGVNFAYYHPGHSTLRQMERNLALYIRACGGRYRIVGEHELDSIGDVDVLFLDFTAQETRDKIDKLLALDKKIILISTANHKNLTDKISHIVDSIIYRPLTASKIIRVYESMMARGDREKLVEREQESISLSGLKILIAEDNPINQKLIVRVLSDMGIESTVANNGQEAYEHYTKSDFDAVLMDIQMPVMGGVEATKKILEYEHDRGLHHTPVIALTANALQGDREMYLRKGFDDYIPKPINLGQLSRVLKTATKTEDEQNKTPDENKKENNHIKIAPNKKTVLMFSTSSGLVQKMHKDALNFAGYEFEVADDIKIFFELLGQKHPYYILVDGRSIQKDECMLVELLKGRDLSVHIFGTIDKSLSCAGVFDEYATVSELLNKIS